MAKKKKANKRVDLNLKKKHILASLIIAAALLFGASGWLWWTRIVTNPDRVLSDSIERNLSMNSVSRHIIQGDSSGGIEQTAHISFFAPNVSTQTSTELTQISGNRGERETKITTETIGTKNADYVRYTSVEGAEGLPGAQNLEKLLGTWAKKEADETKGQSIDFLNESLFGIVPFGRLDQDAKTILLNKINEKNLYNYQSVKREYKKLRPVYVYSMSIKAEDLVEILSEYAKLTGLADPTQFNPADYKGSPPISVDLTIDVFSRNLIAVNYNTTKRSEAYSGWNLYKPANLPETTITIEELQKRLENQPQTPAS